MVGTPEHEYGIFMNTNIDAPVSLAITEVDIVQLGAFVEDALGESDALASSEDDSESPVDSMRESIAQK